MAYDETLAERVRALLDGEPVEERRMFGGLGFLRGGHMCCGVHGERLIVRVGPEAWERALRLRGTAPFDLTGRSLTGFVFVDPAAVRTRRQLGAWLERGLAFARTLPPKRARRA